ncbi:hypothetical protein AC1031_011320 [Aphanomyces cochlioides]|nr:hypothetical protein AC1031_011320 [Aphanomyces cochlioides]
MPRWTKDCAAQKKLEQLIDDQAITAHTKPAIAFNLAPEVFHDFNFPAFRNHFESTMKSKFQTHAGTKRSAAAMDVENDTSSVHVLQDCLTAIPAWSNAIQVHKAEGIVAIYFDYSKDETVVVVVLTPPPGAIVTCQIDEQDTSVLRVKWEWTRQTRDPEFLLQEELAAPTILLDENKAIDSLKSSKAKEEQSKAESDGKYIREMALQSLGKRSRKDENSDSKIDNRQSSLAMAIDCDSKREADWREKELSFKRAKLDASILQQQLD